jgi:hypothetical protein
VYEFGENLGKEKITENWKKIKGENKYDLEFHQNDYKKKDVNLVKLQQEFT